MMAFSFALQLPQPRAGAVLLPAALTLGTEHRDGSAAVQLAEFLWLRG